MNESKPSKIQTSKLAFAGILATLAFEPFGIPVFLIPAFYILLQQIYRAPIRRAFYSGFVFGFFHFISSLYWIGIALTSDVGDFLWLIPFAVLLIPILLGIYTGLICVISSFFKKNRLLFILTFSVTWVITEIIRGYIPVPFPWNFMGYVMASTPYTIALAPLLGVHLCSLLVVFLASVLFSKNLNLTSIAYLSLILGLIITFEDEPKLTEFWDKTIRIVQPNLAEHHLGKPDAQNKTLAILSELSITPDKDSDIKAVIWPEASYPYLFHGAEAELGYLSTLAPAGGYLITGVDRIDSDKHLFNSIVAIGADTKVVSTYDKNILVPFGEYVPFSNLLPFVDKVAYGLSEFTPGAIYSEKLDDIALKYYPLVCYEVIFPIEQDLTQYEWLLNVTNDAWYGRSSGPYQHFAMSKFKAAEYGMPLVRAANTGISGVISPYGEVLGQIDLNTQGIMDIRIPKKIKFEHTMLRDNQIIFISLLFLICLCANLALRIKPSTTSNVNENTTNKQN